MWSTHDLSWKPSSQDTKQSVSTNERTLAAQVSRTHTEAQNEVAGNLSQVPILPKLGGVGAEGVRRAGRRKPQDS